MGWRNIVITNPSRISLQQNQLKIKQNREYYVPLEDIATILIEDDQTVVTARLLNELTKYNIVLYITDEKHLPSGIYQSLYQYSRPLQMLKYQLKMPKPLKKRLWQKIVIQKVINQSKVLEYNSIERFHSIRNLAEKIDSGDTQNIEARAARFYFQFLFGNNFNRDYNIPINAALNYGYSIMRGAVARSLVMYGFLATLGVHHHSELNSFNLADDLMEVYRPLVDLWVYQNMLDEIDFTSNHKHQIYGLLEQTIIINNEKHSVLHSIDLYVKSFSSACRNEDYQLLQLPDVIPLHTHVYE